MAPTEFARLPPRRERTDEAFPPAPTTGSRRSINDITSDQKLLRRDLDEQTRALGYVEEKAERANLAIDGDHKEPGLRAVVHALTKNVESLKQMVSETHAQQRWMIMLLFVIAATLIYMASKTGAQ